MKGSNSESETMKGSNSEGGSLLDGQTESNAKELSEYPLLNFVDQQISEMQERLDQMEDLDHE